MLFVEKVESQRVNRMMKVITLVENTPGAEDCIFEHGLSVYIETKKHKVLVDTGASDAFIKNAEKLNIDLSKVDFLVLSHGHYDHAGGILDFVKINRTAPIYMRPAAAKGYYHLKETEARYIGIDKRISGFPQVIFTNELELVDEQVTMFSGVRGRKLWPKGNMTLKCLENGEYLQDGFEHEQYLVVEEDQERVLISGCAHNGILNILEKYHQIYGSFPDKVITGFHMKKNVPLTEEEKAVVIATAEELKKMVNTYFYSGHCTGEEAFGIMKEIMGEQLIALHSGEVVK